MVIHNMSMCGGGCNYLLVFQNKLIIKKTWYDGVKTNIPVANIRILFYLERRILFLKASFTEASPIEIN